MEAKTEDKTKEMVLLSTLFDGVDEWQIFVVVPQDGDDNRLFVVKANGWHIFHCATLREALYLLAANVAE